MKNIYEIVLTNFNEPNDVQSKTIFFVSDNLNDILSYIRSNKDLTNFVVSNIVMINQGSEVIYI
jgi:hypothetical protein